MTTNELPSGYTIVFGGNDFIPGSFIDNSSLARYAHIVHKGTTLKNGTPAESSWLEFSDIRKGSYPLDLAWEATDFLAAHQDEFLRLSHYPGITFRTLNLFGDAASCSIEFEPNRITLLHTLSIHLSITVH